MASGQISFLNLWMFFKDDPCAWSANKLGKSRQTRTHIQQDVTSVCITQPLWTNTRVQEPSLREVQKDAEERASVQGGVNPPQRSSSTGFSVLLGLGGLTPPSS